MKAILQQQLQLNTYAAGLAPPLHYLRGRPLCRTPTLAPGMLIAVAGAD